MRHVARQFGAGIGMQICKCQVQLPPENLLLGSEENAAKRMQAKWNSLSHFDWPSLAIGLVDRRSKTEDWRPRRPKTGQPKTGDTGLPFRFYWQHVCQVPGASGTVRSPPTRLANGFRDGFGL